MEERARIPVGPPVNNPLPSYWHNPKSPLANVIEPETDKPTQTYDYAIIGSGISGTMIAYNLFKTKPSSRIVMVEAREVCGGATGRNGGHTKAASYRTYLHHLQELGKEEALKIARLEYANIFETHHMAKEMEIKCESAPCNTVDIIYDAASFSHAKASIEALRADATEFERQEGEMAWYKVHEKSPETLQQFHVASTNTNPTVPENEEVAGIIEYSAGRIDAYRFSTAILATCVKQGLVLCTNTPVHSILPSYNSTDDDTSWDIFTQYTTLTTRSVIFATNGYTPYLLPSFQGVIVPMRGQITAQQPSGHAGNQWPRPLPTTYSFIYKDGYEYMIPRVYSSNKDSDSDENGEVQDIIIGGGLGRLPEKGKVEFGTVDDSTLNTDISKYLHNALLGYVSSDSHSVSKVDKESSFEVVQEWTGIMGATSDGRPFVGQIPDKKGMWVCAGFNGHGMVLCVKSAEALVGKMLEGKWAEWWPRSFEVSEERLKGVFGGRIDMSVEER
jgi:glycine/D-amino acid oxidase-like deaminating enzyme